MKAGIVLVALGYELYGSCAFNLVAGLKAYDPGIQVAIIHDDKAIAHLTDLERKLFDVFIKADEADYIHGGKVHYPRVKLLLNKYSPFDVTMYMDVDNIWHPFKRVSQLMGELLTKPFFIQANGHYDRPTDRSTFKNYTYWGEPDRICDYHSLKYLPQTVAGFFGFHKGEYSDKVFSLALDAYDDPKAPCINWAGSRPDEYGFNVALGELGAKVIPFHAFYFHKISGRLTNDTIYHRYWGTSTGGATVPDRIVMIYNKLVNKYCMMHGVPTRRYHVNKTSVIADRKNM